MTFVFQTCAFVATGTGRSMLGSWMRVNGCWWLHVVCGSAALGYGDVLPSGSTTLSCASLYSASYPFPPRRNLIPTNKTRCLIIWWVSVSVFLSECDCGQVWFSTLSERTTSCESSARKTIYQIKRTGMIEEHQDTTSGVVYLVVLVVVVGISSRSHLYQ